MHKMHFLTMQISCPTVLKVAIASNQEYNMHHASTFHFRNTILQYAPIQAGHSCALWIPKTQSRSHTPLQYCKRKGGSGEYSTLLLTSTEFQSDWLMWQLSHLQWAFLPQTTYHTFTDSQHTLQFTEAQQDTSKAWFLGKSIATASPQCEDVPDSPFLFGGWSGNVQLLVTLLSEYNQLLLLHSCSDTAPFVLQQKQVTFKN